MKEFKVNSIEELIKLINDFPNNYIYRGQADANWHLQSSLERILDKEWSIESAQKFEEFSLHQFKAKFHLYDRENIQPESKLAWLSMILPIF